MGERKLDNLLVQCSEMTADTQL